MPVATMKVVLVTGASRGIGQAIFQGFLQQPDRIVIGTATSAAGADALSSQVAAAGRQGEGMVLNVADPLQIASCLEQIQTKYGNVDILINNAAITRDNLLLLMSDQEWDDVINTNLNAGFHLIKNCLRGMMRSRWGRVISISSVVGLTGNAGQANYAAAKAGVIAMMKSLAQELGSRQVTFNIVAPGFIETDMTRDLPDTIKEQLLSKIPLKRLGAPEDVANAVLFLASEQAGYITGETLSVNGGMFMG